LVYKRGFGNRDVGGVHGDNRGKGGANIESKAPLFSKNPSGKNKKKKKKKKKRKKEEKLRGKRGHPEGKKF